MWAGVIGGPLLWVKGQQVGLRKVLWREESKLPAGQTSSEQLPDTQEQLDLGGVLRSEF